MAERGGHHHGEAIRAYRLQAGLTQAQLATQWPGGPINPQYIQRVETGKKRITDQETLRRLAALLDIPLWRFGLSEYDPFAPHNLPGAGLRMYEETLDAAECLVQTVWSLRLAALLPEAERCLRRLNALFAQFRRELPPPARLEARYLRLHAQVLRLNAVVAVEGKQYPAALALYVRMRGIAEQLGEPATLALALMSTGAELERAGRKREAVDWLERARDISFGASKQIAAFVNSYLARAYASAGDGPRFERAAETARTLAQRLGERYGDGTDFIYARPSSVLAELSWGWLELRAPLRTLALRGELAAQIERDGDRRLHAWIPLDWARAYLAQGEVEAALAEAGEFGRRAEAMGSPHALRHVGRFVTQVEAAGHVGLPAVRALRERYGAMSDQAS